MIFEGDRVKSLDPEDDGAEGTVVIRVMSGGLKVRWDYDGHENWTQEGPTLKKLPKGE